MNKLDIDLRNWLCYFTIAELDWIRLIYGELLINTTGQCRPVYLIWVRFLSSWNEKLGKIFQRKVDSKATIRFLGISKGRKGENALIS